MQPISENGQAEQPALQRLAEEKLRQELEDLRRPYLFRNPQLLTALITSVGAIIGVSLLINDNYFKIREQLNRAQAEETRRLTEQAQQSLRVAAGAKQQADAIAKDAEAIKVDAGKKIDDANRQLALANSTRASAERTKADANRQIIESRQQLTAANSRLEVARNALTDVEWQLRSVELATKAEDLIGQREYRAAQEAATEAWSLKHTDRALQAMVHAYSYASVTLVGHTAQLYDAQYSPDGGRVVTASGDFTARVWDAKTGKQLARMDGHAKDVLTADFSPDGQRVLTTSDDGTTRVWLAETGSPLAVIQHPLFRFFGSARRHATAWSPDSKYVATAGNDGIVRVSDAKTGQQRSEMKGHAAAVAIVAFSPDGRHVASGSSGRTNSDDQSPSGLSTDHTVRIWDADNGRQLAQMDGHTAEITALMFSSDGERLLSGSEDGSARVWDATTGRQLLKIDHFEDGRSGYVKSAAFSQDGQRILTKDLGDNKARVWDASGKLLVEIGNNSGLAIYSVAFSSDGKRLVTTGSADPVRIWDAATGQQLAQLEQLVTEFGTNTSADQASFSPDGRRILATPNQRGSLFIASIYEIVSPLELAAQMSVKQ